jgi:hypothetical protein
VLELGDTVSTFRLDDRVWRDCWQLSVRLLWDSLLAFFVCPPLRRRTKVAGCVALHGQTLLQVTQREAICQSGVYFSESACICGWSSGANALQRGQCFAGPMLCKPAPSFSLLSFSCKSLPGGYWQHDFLILLELRLHVAGYIPME